MLIFNELSLYKALHKTLLQFDMLHEQISGCLDVNSILHAYMHEGECVTVFMHCACECLFLFTGTQRPTFYKHFLKPSLEHSLSFHQDFEQQNQMRANSVSIYISCATPWPWAQKY